MKKASDSTDVETNLARFLFHYRSTPTTTTGVSPAELFLKRSMRTHLQLMRPNMEMRVKLKLLQQKMVHSKGRNLLTSQLVIWCMCVIGPRDQDGFLELLMSKDLPISMYKLKTGVFFIDILIKCEDSYLQLEPQMIAYPVPFQEMM